jgi:hypothetical protein
MKKLIAAIALTFAVSASAASVYELALNEDGYATQQSNHVKAYESTVYWFVPNWGTDGNTYLFQFSNGSDSPQGAKYDVVLTDENYTTLAQASGYYPSLYLKVGKDISELRTYFLTVTRHENNRTVNRPNNVHVLIQRIEQ